MKLGKLVAAPLAGISDLPFRILCRKYGAHLSYTEMISSETILRKNKAVKDLTLTCSEDFPLAVQIFGHDAKRMADAAQKIEPIADVIDINLGCPAPKVANQKAGAGMLRDLSLTRKVISKVVLSVDVPVSVKTRLGVDNKKDTVFDVAKMCEELGVSFLCVHGRTLKQGYGGVADWDKIAKVASNVSIPVIANGDVKSKDDVDAIMKQTGCKSVMVGRASIGNPGIFAKLRGQKSIPKEKQFYEYISLCKDFGMYDISRIRPQMMYFTRDMGGSRAFRANLSKIKKLDMLMDEFNKFVDKNRPWFV